MAKKAKHPNISANLYDGDFAVYADCIGEDVCRFKRTYTIPAEENAECVCLRNGVCTNNIRVATAAKALAQKLSDYANNFGSED